MCGFDVEVDKLSLVEELVKDLNTINLQIAEATVFKKKIERAICEQLGRAQFDQDEENGKILIKSINHEGTLTHEVGKYKVTIKTDYIYKINKSEYEILKNQFSKEFNPVKTKTAYTVDKDKFQKISEYGSLDDIKLRDEIITLIPSSPSITIKVNV